MAVDRKAYRSAKLAVAQASDWQALGAALHAVRDALKIRNCDMGINKGVIQNIEIGSIGNPNVPEAGGYISGIKFFSYCSELGLAEEELPAFAREVMGPKRDKEEQRDRIVEEKELKFYRVRNWGELGSAVNELMRARNRSAGLGALAKQAQVPKSEVEKLVRGLGMHIPPDHREAIFRALKIDSSRLRAFAGAYRPLITEAGFQPTNDTDISFEQYLRDRDRRISR